jgi:hypothetical protein
MEVLEVAGRILVGWVLCSMITAVGWSRFMGHVRRKEHTLRAMQVTGHYDNVHTERVKPAA